MVKRQPRPINEDTVITRQLPQDLLELAYEKAKKCPIEGGTCIRGYAEQRDLTKDKDIFVGSVFELACSLEFFTLQHYLDKREKSENNKYLSDKGSDTEGYPIDYKGRDSRDDLGYKMLFPIRLKDRYPGNIYIHGTVTTYNMSPEIITFGKLFKPIISIIGWIENEAIDDVCFREYTGTYGPKNGQPAAYLVKPHDLRDIHALKYALANSKV